GCLDDEHAHRWRDVEDRSWNDRAVEEGILERLRAFNHQPRPPDLAKCPRVWRRDRAHEAIDLLRAVRPVDPAVFRRSLGVKARLFVRLGYVHGLAIEDLTQMAPN